MSAHYQKVVSRENVCLTSHKQVRPNFTVWPNSLVKSMASLPIQIPSSLSVRGGSVAMGILTPSPYAVPSNHTLWSLWNMGKVSLGFGCSQQSALVLLALLGCDYMIEKN